MNASSKFRYDPDYSVPPGRSVEERMRELGLTQREFALRTGLTVQTIARIFKGEQPISYETANRLEMVLGETATYWNNLESLYQEKKSKREQEKLLAEEQAWLKEIPVKELVKRGVLSESDDNGARVRNALKFFGVSSVPAWREIWEKPAIAARRSVTTVSHVGSASTWLRLAQVSAHGTKCAPYSALGFENALKDIRKFTLLEQSKFWPKLKASCAQVGVAVVLVPELKGAPWYGAANWLSPDKAMIALSFRGKAEDHFWFTFFHEACHILKHSKKMTFMDEGDIFKPEGYQESTQEVEANEFAALTLVPQEFRPELRAIRSGAQLMAIAERINVSPGVVAGQYRFLTKHWSYYHGLTKKFSWDEESPLG